MEKMTKLIHLSDLHLGKRLNEFSLLEDQKYILKQILRIISEEKPDGVILAGDLYDKSVPSGEAVQLFDWFLTELAERKTAVFAISGNHDSAERIAFGAGLMGEKKVHFSPVYQGEMKRVTMEDQYGPVHIWLMPFLKPAMVRHTVAEEEKDQITDYESAIQKVLDGMDIRKEERNVLVAHQFVVGASTCDSEELNVGGLDQISGSLFDDFDYVALGHIHSPQKLGRETVRYCGTPLKYSFSEVNQEKSVTVVELYEKGKVVIRTIPLRPFRDMRKLKGTYQELMARESYEGTNTEDYIHVTLTDEEDIPDCMRRLRTVYPNLMQMSYDNKRTRFNQEILAVEGEEKKTELELFEELYEMKNNQPMNPEQKEFITELITNLKEGR